MTDLAMTRTLTLFALASLALASPVAAQTAVPPPSLKASVTVASDFVRIGDLVENAGIVADVAIFRAPDLGTTGAVATARVVEAIRSHELIGIDTRGLDEVVVTRASRVIAVPEIAAQVAHVLAQQYGLGEARNLSVRFERDVHTLQVEASSRGALKATRVYYDPRTARFDITFDLDGSASMQRQPLRVTGTAIETVDAVVITRPMEHGDVIKDSDVAVERRPKTEMSGSVVASREAAVGLAARRALRPGQPLRDADLMKPEIVQRNDSVTIVFQAPGMVLTIRGKAQEAGALGDIIGVLNVQSKRVVQGKISGPGHVTVTAATARVVENAPAASSAAASSRGVE
jgi:flagella basal body P-ring formation protein FlgA